jgi:hypothetical protein
MCVLVLQVVSWRGPPAVDLEDYRAVAALYVHRVLLQAGAPEPMYANGRVLSNALARRHCCVQRVSAMH